MNNTSLNCSIKDTTELRNLILENPELPVLIFCGEDAWNSDYGYSQGEVKRIEVEELTLYGEQWLEKDDYEEELEEGLCDEEEYKDWSDEEFDRMIKQKVEETEFVKAIVIYVG